MTEMESHIDQWKWQLTKCYEEQAKMVIGTSQCNASRDYTTVLNCTRRVG